VAHALRLYGPGLPRLRHLWADAAYSGALIDDLRDQMGWRLEIVNRSATVQRPNPSTSLRCSRIVGSSSEPLPGGAVSAD